MCNFYTLRLSAAELADQFGVANSVASNAGEEVYPGTPGLVIRETDGQRVIQSMTWGFPLRLKTMAPTAKPKPVNNIADLAKPMWKGLAAKPQWRCLIPLTAFAEAEGPKGPRRGRGSAWSISLCSPGLAYGATVRNGGRSTRA